jgi:hypothetical protein
MDNIVGGTTAILGAVAYRLAKERRLGLKPDSGMLRSIETALLALVFAAPVVQTVLGADFVTRPWSNLLIPVWTLIAYLFVRLKKTTTPFHLIADLGGGKHRNPLFWHRLGRGLSCCDPG